MNTKVLKGMVVETANHCGKEVKTTRSGDVCVDQAVLADLGAHNRTLATLLERKKLAKIQADLEKIQAGGAQIIHPRYATLVSSGRTSCSGSSLYPSLNIQNQPVGLLGCFTARPGHVLYCCDYSSIELVTLAYTCEQLFGKSVMADKLRAGINLHSYLGSQLASTLDPAFREEVGAGDAYLIFMEKKTTHPNFYDHWRTLAKPTGLGYPGGLAPTTWVAMAKADYGINTTPEVGARIRQVWLATYSEMSKYFKFVSGYCTDKNHPEAFCYISPSGMIRRNMIYTSACNGLGMQTPTAEGAKAALVELSRRSYFDTRSPLYGKHHIVGFRHDEVIGEIEEDADLPTIVDEIKKAMEGPAGMGSIVPTIPVSTEIRLMRRWAKKTPYEGATVYENQDHPDNFSELVSTS